MGYEGLAAMCYVNMLCGSQQYDVVTQGFHAFTFSGER